MVSFFFLFFVNFSSKYRQILFDLNQFGGAMKMVFLGFFSFKS